MGHGGSRGNAAPTRGVPEQHGGSSRPPGHADASPTPPRNSGNAWGNGGNAWNTHGKGQGNGSGRGDNVPPRANPGQHNGNGNTNGGSGNAWNIRGNGNGSGKWNGNSSAGGHANNNSSGDRSGKDNWRKDDNRTGDHSSNWSGNNFASGSGQKYGPTRNYDSHVDNRTYFNNRTHFNYSGHVYHAPRVVTTLPVGYRHYSWNGGAYYQHAGLWYRPYGTRYVVVGAPYGMFVPYLPSYHSSFWFGGVRYFHSDSTYYLYEPAQRGYVVTQSPYETEEGESGSSDTTDEDLYIYPAQGQSEQQQSDDRYECHSWAVQETGYDPIDSDYDADRRAEYLRAMTACLTGRGYSVR